MKKILTLALLAATSLAASAAEIHLYAGAGLKEPVEKIIKQYEAESGNTVTVEYAGSGQLLARFNATHSGDLYLPGSADYIDKLAADNPAAVVARAPIALHIPVLAIRKDKSAGIDSYAALAKSDLRLGIGDSKAMALGKGAEKILALSGHEKALEEKIVVRAATVKQLMLYLLNGDVDAAIVGRAGAWKQRDKLDILPNPPGTPEEHITIALLGTSKEREAAQALFDLFKSPQGIAAFTDDGFLPLPEAKP